MTCVCDKLLLLPGAFHDGIDRPLRKNHDQNINKEKTEYIRGERHQRHIANRAQLGIAIHEHGFINAVSER